MPQTQIQALYRELQSYVGWTADDASRVRQAAGLLEPRFPALIDDFYRQITRHPNVSRTITGGEAQVERLKGALNVWLRGLVSGQYDAQYVSRRWQVGMRHVEVGLDEAFTSVALGRLRRGLLRSLREAWPGEPRELLATCESLNVLLDLDLAIIADAYQSDFRAFRTLPAIALVLDPEGRIVRFNAYMEELSGYRLADVKGNDFFSTFLPASIRARTRAAFEQTLHDKQIGASVHAIQTRDGRQRQIKWANKILADAQGRPSLVLAIGHDLTDLQEAQEKALQAERLAAIGEMMAGLTHESRNALQRSKACLEMLELEVADRPTALDLVGRLNRAQEHLQRLYEEVRHYAAPIQLSREPCDLRHLWQETWSQLAPLHPHKQVAFEEQVSQVEDFRCLADRFAMGQVFRNILENALAAAPDSGRIVVSTAETIIEGAAALEIGFADDGPGLDANQRQRIFEPFFTTKTKGTGLGMAIAKRIVESHGGQIGVRDRSLPGAEIALALPRGDL